MLTPETTPQEVLTPALDGSLRVLILPLRVVALSRCEPVHVDEDLPAHLLPAQYASMGADLSHLDIGFGIPTLVATREVGLRASEGPLTFGRSRATVDDAIACDEQPMDIVEVATPAVQFSLWATPSGLVLTVETLAHIETEAGLRLPGLPEPDFTVDADIITALSHALGQVGLPRDATLRDVVGPAAASVQCADSPVMALVHDSVERIRREPLASGAYVIVEAEATSKAKSLLEAPNGDDFESLFHDQTTGAPRTWLPLPLADDPAQAAARSALRADGRVALVNLESTSVWHDYLGHGAGLILATLPVLAHVAVSETDYLMLEEVALDPGKHSLDEQLTLVHKLRRRRLRRTVERRRATPERFSRWTQPTTLATALLAARASILRAQDDDLEQLAAVVADGLEVARAAERERLAAEESRRAAEEQAKEERRHARDRQIEAHRAARERKIDLLVALVSPVAGLAVIAGIFTAFASVPDDAKNAVLLGTSGALKATLVVTIFGVAIGGAIIWYSSRQQQIDPDDGTDASQGN